MLIVEFEYPCPQTSGTRYSIQFALPSTTRVSTRLLANCTLGELTEMSRPNQWRRMNVQLWRGKTETSERPIRKMFARVFVIPYSSLVGEVGTFKTISHRTDILAIPTPPPYRAQTLIPSVVLGCIHTTRRGKKEITDTPR